MVQMTSRHNLRGDDLLIFQRHQSPNWQCRIKLDGEDYIFKSLRTGDRGEAELRAHDLLAEFRLRKKQGLALRSMTFEKVALELLEKMDFDVANGVMKSEKRNNFRSCLNSYLLPYLGTKDIASISDAEICRYQEWRRNYYLSGPGVTKHTITYERIHALTGKLERVRRPHKPTVRVASSTLRNESAHLRKIFDYARRCGYIEGQHIPKVEDPPLKSNQRPHFDLADYRTLIRKSVWWYKLAPTARVQFDRQLLHDWILIMSNPGMRIGEARNLKWGNVVYRTTGSGDTVVTLFVSGKGKKRELVAMPHTKIYLDRLRARTQFNQPDDHVFVGRYGRPVQSFVSGFNALLKHAGVAHDVFGNKRTPYSLRHTYASFALLYGRVNVYTLVVNMGTSVEMIEKHYGHLKPLQAYKELTTRYKI